VNATPAATATRGGAFLALALAEALTLGLPDPDYITMNPPLAGSTTTSAAGFQFNDLHGQDPLPAMQAWADRFGVTVDTSTSTSDPGTTWHQFDFTHAGVRIHAYAAIKDAAGDELLCGSRPYPAGSEGDDGTECMLPKGHDGPHADAPETEAAR
jgi:hypothetical protein